MAIFIFDAYGTLFDVAGAARAHPAVTAHWQALAEDWRRKQLEYTWLRRIMDAHTDFRAITAEALGWALEAHRLPQSLHPDLMALYDRLPAYLEVPDVLRALATGGHRLAILSNGTPEMLASAEQAAGLDGLFESVISVEEIGCYKPDARVYALGCARMGCAAKDVTFASSNGWDIAGASRFGYHTCWINRARAPADRLPAGPAQILPDLTGLLTLDLA